jgi:type IV pilus assembly protein PilC
MVAAGEASGTLHVAMDRVSTQLEKSSKTQALVKKAMIYPIAIVIVAIVVTIVMLVVVIPNYESMFADLGTELPAITKFYVALSNGLINYWFIIIPAIAAVVAGIIAFSKTLAGKHFFGMIALKVPILKNMTVKSASAQMARTLGTLLGSGVSLVEATEIVSGIMGNVYFKEALKDASDQVSIGMPLSRPLEDCGLFPPMVYHMLRIGEESGNTEEMLDKLADYYDEEVEMAVQSLMAAMEPMIIVVLAVVVGGLVAACMAPMLTMYTALDSM